MDMYYEELSSLFRDLGVSPGALYSLSNNIYKHYSQRYIVKENGDTRTLCIPDALLKKVQGRIAEVLLSAEEISQYATAYRKGGGTVRNARPHVGAEEMLKLDIRHFFDNITYWQVKTLVFREERYAEPLRVLLTMLCIHKSSLPQGAPSSPVISNIIMRSFDDAVGSWCKERGIRYTRYCDDMTFSGKKIPCELKPFVETELRKMGYFLNRKKTVSVKQGQRMEVTGIVVNERLTVSNEYRSKIRQEIYYCRKFGIMSHIRHSALEIGEFEYLERLLGRINYVLSIDPDDKEIKNYKIWVKDAMSVIGRNQ